MTNKKQIEEATKAGLCLGHRTSQTHPNMKPYLLMEKQNIHIIDIEKTIEKLQEALDFIKSSKKEGKNFLIVGTKIQIKEATKKMAQECKISYVTKRWLGGTLTNFQTIKKRIDYFKELKERNLDKYTKKEKLDFEREIEDLELNFGGVEGMEKLPDVLIVLDVKKDFIAVREAKKKDIPVVGIIDTNVNPELVDYPIPANDDKISSLEYILNQIKQVLL